jgi:hypothetical protein
MGALLELPIQDVIETFHGGDPYAAPQTIVIAGSCTCQHQGQPSAICGAGETDNAER